MSTSNPSGALLNPLQLFAGKNWTGARNRTYVRFDLPQNLGNITGGQYEVRKESTNNPVLNVHDLYQTVKWMYPNTVSWNDQPISTDANGANLLYELIDSRNTEPGAAFYRFNITPALKRWYAPSGRNNGLVITTSDETKTERADLHSSRAILSNNRPAVWFSYDMLAAPTINGPTTMTLIEGYAATSTGAYTITGNLTPDVTKTSGNGKITWNNTTKKLDIAAGLAAGSYPVVLKASNSVKPDATITFTLTVGVAQTAPTITGPTRMMLTEGYAATSTGMYTVTGNPAPTVTKTSGNEKITWNNTTKKLEIATGLTVGSYPVVLKVSNGVNPDATITFTLEVSLDPVAPKLTSANNMTAVNGNRLA